MKKAKILIASKIDASAITKLEEKFDVIFAFNADSETLKEKIKECSILVFRSGVQITREVMQSSDKLRLILRAGSGVDNIDMNYVAENPSIKLVRIPQPGARAVAELSFALMLALSRSLIVANQSVQEGRWIKNQLTGYLLKNKVLGIVGAGNIGCTVGQMGHSWGMNVIGCIDEATHPADVKPADYGVELMSLEEVMKRSDYVSIHVPKTEKTIYMINKENLSLMKPGAFLMTLARGKVVNEKDLLGALTKENGLGGAGLDVHEVEGEGMKSPLAGLPNVILTPHIGAATYDSMYEIGQIVIKHANEFYNSL